MISLPNLGKTASTPGPVLIDPSAASAPARALVSVGRGLQQAGNEAGGIALDIQEAENQAEISKALRTMSKSQADFELSLGDDHDYKNYLKRAEEEVLNPAREMISPDLAPSVQRELRSRMDAWEHQVRTRTNERSRLKAVERAKHGLELEREAFLENGDLAGFQKRVDGQKYLTPEERESMKRSAERYHRDRQVEMDIQRDPEGWLKNNGEYKNGDLGKHRARVRLARQGIMENTREAFDSAADLIAEGKLTDDKQVDRLFPDLRPAAREKIKDWVAESQDEGLKRELAKPENQERLAGEIAAMIRGYEPSGEDFDADYVAIRQRIRGLNAGPLKEEFENQVKGLRSEEEASQAREVKSKSDWAFLQLEEHYEAGLFGKVDEPKGKSLGAYLDDGLLNDAEILQRFGYSEKVADNIAKLAEKGNRSAAIDLLRDEWDKGNARDEDFPAGLGAAFDAIRNYKGNTHQVVTPAAESEFEQAKLERTRAYGRAQLELADWLRLNPEAQIETISDRLKEMGIRVEAGQSNSSNFKPAPRRNVEGGTVEKVSSLSLPRNLLDHEDSFIKWGNKYGVDPRFLAAISRLETDNGKSSAFKNKKNAMGVSNSKGPISFSSVDASIKRMASVLGSSKGPYRNARSLAEIGKIYAPPGAGNDVNGTNGYWPRGVAKYLRELGVSSPYTATLVSR